MGQAKVRTGVKHDPVLKIERQRCLGDCTIACLASITGRSYEDILVEAGKEGQKYPHDNGLYFTNIINIASRLGYPMKYKKPVNFHLDKGILATVLFARRVYHRHHAVVLMAGLIFDFSDSAPTVWVPDTFKKRYSCHFGGILVPHPAP